MLGGGGSAGGPGGSPSVGGDVGQGRPRGVAEPPFSIGGLANGGGVVELDSGDIAFGGFEWAVPALVLSVPGLFLIIAVAVEGAIGLAWLPVARRWVGDDARRRRRRPLVSG